MSDPWARNADGTFAKGNRGGPGRETRVVEENYLQLFREAVSDEDIKKIIRKAVKQATEQGSWKARDFIFDRMFGKPRQVGEVEETQTLFMKLLLAWVGGEAGQAHALAAELRGVPVLPAEVPDAGAGAES